MGSTTTLVSIYFVFFDREVFVHDQFSFLYISHDGMYGDARESGYSRSCADFVGGRLDAYAGYVSQVAVERLLVEISRLGAAYARVSALYRVADAVVPAHHPA